MPVSFDVTYLGPCSVYIDSTLGLRWERDVSVYRMSPQEKTELMSRAGCSEEGEPRPDAPCPDTRWALTPVPPE
ncbi:hypothetical protein LCGC14_3118820 [marine sediment metagenome]|uniref:Uncharacterized protein n=1 Tax=marine sediment metagenome TaxID=412755 RepID=A0A0F8YAC6_9ZZZZ